MSDSLALVLQVFVSHLVWLLGIKLVSSGRSPSVLKAEPSLRLLFPFTLVIFPYL